MGCCKCCCCCVLFAVLIIAFSLGLFATLFPFPSHASCTAEWTFGGSCSAVEDKLVDQIKEWSNNDCSTKQRCGYDFQGKDGNVIRATHTTPYLHFTDTFNFTFNNNDNGCSVVGMSRSVTWYAVIDFGQNYCNMKNLIMGSNLDEHDSQYSETSNNTVCTFYSIAHCNLYS